MADIENLKPFMEIYPRGCLKNDTKIRINSFTSKEEFVKIFHTFFSQNPKVQVIEATFITHGFISNIEKDNVPEMKTAILNCPTDNPLIKDRIVVLVDWSFACGWTGTPWTDWLKYTSALRNRRHIAMWLAGYISALKNELGDKVYVHGIGHSLGAHLMGMTGKAGGQLLTNKSVKLFDRITGLDPAGHRVSKGDYCLDKEDATWVDVIHTSTWLGRSDCNGSVDFFPNWGQTQPGCSSWTNESHMRVLDFFLSSISNPGKFTTTKQFEISDLKNWGSPPLVNGHYSAEMGYHCKSGTEGVWYIETIDKDPWFVNY